MRNTIWNKRIPTIFGLIIIVIGIGATTFLVQKGVIFTGLAGPSDSPKNIRITNVSDTSFTVSFVTDASVLASLNFGKDKNLGQTALDDREQNGSLSPRTGHYITVKNLTPETTYYFSIISGQDTFLQNGVPFVIKTGPSIKVPSASEKKISGKILMPDGTTPKEAIVYLASENAQTISRLAKEDGSYEISLTSLRTNDLSSYADLQDNSLIKMLMVSGTLSSNVQFSVWQGQAPVPPITLSYDYDFTVSSTPSASQSAMVSSSLPVSSRESTAKTPQIIIPRKSQGFSDSQPKFQGTALPNATVQIIIQSLENMQARITADALGNWTYRPTQPLSPGNHTITIATKDAFGILKTITTSFVVFASGSQLTQSATPSATPTFTPSLSPSPSPTITPTPTPTPTTAPTQSPIISISPTLPPPIKPPPPGNANVVAVGIMGAIIASLGIFIFLLTRVLPL